MNDEVAIVRRYGFGERDTSDPSPVLAGEPLGAGEPMLFAGIGHGDVEDKPATAREWIVGIIEDAQDFVAKIDSPAVRARRFVGDGQTHEARAGGRLACGLAKLCDFVKLPLGGPRVGDGERDANPEQLKDVFAAVPWRDGRRVCKDPSLPQRRSAPDLTVRCEAAASKPSGVSRENKL